MAHISVPPVPRGKQGPQLRPYNPSTETVPVEGLFTMSPYSVSSSSSSSSSPSVGVTVAKAAASTSLFKAIVISAVILSVTGVIVAAVTLGTLVPFRTISNSNIELIDSRLRAVEDIAVNLAANNVGTLGVGTYSGKTGDTLHMRNIAPGTLTTVMLDDHNNIVIDVNAVLLGQVEIVTPPGGGILGGQTVPLGTSITLSLDTDQTFSTLTVTKHATLYNVSLENVQCAALLPESCIPPVTALPSSPTFDNINVTNTLFVNQVECAALLPDSCVAPAVALPSSPTFDNINVTSTLFVNQVECASWLPDSCVPPAVPLPTSPTFDNVNVTSTLIVNQVQCEGGSLPDTCTNPYPTFVDVNVTSILHVNQVQCLGGTLPSSCVTPMVMDNVGVVGVGVFDSQVSGTFHMRNVAPGAYTTVTLVGNDIVVDFNITALGIHDINVVTTGGILGGQLVSLGDTLSLSLADAQSFVMLTVSGSTLLGTSTSCVAPLLPSCLDISGQSCTTPLLSSCVDPDLTLNSLTVHTLYLVNATTLNVPIGNQTALYVDELFVSNEHLAGTLSCTGLGRVDNGCLDLGGYTCPTGSPIAESCIPASLIQYNMSVTNMLTLNQVECLGGPLPSSCVSNVPGGTAGGQLAGMYPNPTLAIPLTLPAATTPAGGIAFGADANLYRSAVGMLKTDTDLTTRSLTFPSATTPAGGLLFGTDTNLYRSGTQNLQTDSKVSIVPGLTANTAVTGLVVSPLISVTPLTTGTAVNMLGISGTNAMAALPSTIGPIGTYSIANAGSGYTVSNCYILITGGDGQASLQITSVGAGGSVLTTVWNPFRAPGGNNYVVASNVATILYANNMCGGTGSGFSVNILTIAPAAYPASPASLVFPSATGVRGQGISVVAGVAAKATITTTTAISVINNALGTGPMVVGTQIGLDVPALTTLSTNAYGARLAAPTGGSSINNALNFVASTLAAGGITFGTDANLYRSAVGMLKTDTDLTVRSLTFPAAVTSAGGLKFGTDTNLYRSGAGVLTTDTDLNVRVLTAVNVSVTNELIINSAQCLTLLPSSCIGAGGATGTAGGALAGTYPNPTLASTITAGGPIGSGTTVPVITYNAAGQLTSVTSTTITGAPPTGAAGGDLQGTYPNPTIAPSGVSAGTKDLLQAATLTIAANGRLTAYTPYNQPRFSYYSTPGFVDYDAGNIINIPNAHYNEGFVYANGVLTAQYQAVLWISATCFFGSNGGGFNLVHVGSGNTYLSVQSAATGLKSFVWSNVVVVATGHQLYFTPTAFNGFYQCTFNGVMISKGS